MEKDLIALVFIALLVGLGGGYGLGYVIYHPQIQNLQNSITDLSSTIEMMENRTWHEVYSLASSSDVITGIFQLKGSSVRVMWIAEGYDSLAWVSFQLQFSNGTAYGVWRSSGVRTATNAVLELSKSGDYYLNITSYLTNYYVSVWDYY